MFKDNNSGYTLVEIVLAIAILGLVFVPVLGFLTSSSGIITYADMREMALLVAQQRMELLKSLGFENLTLTGGFYTLVDAEYPEYNSNKYKISTIKEKIEKAQVNGNTVDYLYDITIEVYWDNDNKHVTLKSKLADR